MHHTAHFTPNKIVVYERGHTVSSVARGIGVAQSTVSLTLDGKRANPDVQKKIADFLGLRPSEVFGEHTHPSLTAAEAA